MEKIAFVIIRYGRDVNGGAEAHCRMLARRLAADYRVEVLTTTLRVFDDRQQDFPEGVSVEEGITVRRFTPQPIDGQRHEALYRRSKLTRRIRRWLDRVGLLGIVSTLHPRWSLGREAERRAIESQPSHTPRMMTFIREHGTEYRALFFMNYYFSQTILGATIHPERSILIPLAHPNHSLYYGIEAEMFTRVRHIAFNTRAEERMCRRIFGRAMAPSSIVGCGIEPVEPADWTTVRARYGLPESYVLYLGRVTRSKIGRLIPEFLRYKQRYGGTARLVMVGGIDAGIERPAGDEILMTGFVDDAEKSAIVRHATLMINPSAQESLSLLMLEALQNRIPVLVNGRSEVMKDHCRLSGAALWYDGWHDFRRKLHRLLDDEALRRQLAARGPAYVEANYSWKVILTRLRALIENR
ncbi:glycosyltransferase family 4 protein [Alistipes sp.]|uniref:glycosyltransferase family 4 protein n=1 Tax=Alistipes sp. TaxID=1872444 RepID=UPI003A85EC81